MTDELLNYLADRFRALGLSRYGCTFVDYLIDQTRTEERAEAVLRRIRKARYTRLTSNGTKVRLIRVI